MPNRFKRETHLIFYRKQIPRYLNEKKNLFSTVLCITLFSVIFMNIYSPFSTTTWFSFTNKRELTGMLAFYTVSISLLITTKQIFHKINSKKLMTIAGVILFFLSEIVIITAIYVLFTKIFIAQDNIKMRLILYRATACVTFILTLPYIVCILYSTVKYQNTLLRDRKNHSIPLKKNHLVNLCDQKGKIKLSISPDDLLYVASRDNYVKIFYEHGDKVINYMLRSTTKNIEDHFGKELIRCHRSYLVNINKIKLFNNNRDNMFITLKNNLVNPIPVSRSYRKNIECFLDNEPKNTRA